MYCVSEANAREAQPSTSSSVPEGERDKQQVVEASKDQHEPVKGVDTAPTGRDTPPDVRPPVSVTEPGEERMDVSRDEGSSLAGKRSHERTTDSEPQRDDGGGGEPPTKTPGNVKVQETPPGLTPPEQLDSRAGDRQEEVKEGSESQKAQSSGDQDSEGPQYEEMDVASTSGSVTKRSRDQATGEQDHTGDPTSEEPPPKAVVTRRPTFATKAEHSAG
ncbi:hypothetical protein HPB50_017128 [Hyalomma asiaticum]|uniref:Uncharacterized protein n=1 Tax=Hyalomma asiaticum TaxID=266040 RepID=A0ACB7TLU3_HYAAI|nr:hypothetical protein HPB50_017128 [Hyalomma asiaticum]